MENDKMGAWNGHTETGNEHEQEYIGLILAAGYSSRMGAFKPLLPIGDMTAIERVAAALKQAGVRKIIGVTGFLRRRLVPVFASEGIVEAYNPDFEQGMFVSIKAGLRTAAGLKPDAVSCTEPAAKPDAGPDGQGGFFLMLVDCPLVPPAVIRQIAEKHKEDPEAFIVPCFRGKKGHPLFIPAQYAEEILAYEGEGGLKAITDRHEDGLIRLEVGTEAVVLDMDTPDGYEEVLEYYKAHTEETCGRDGNPASGNRIGGRAPVGTVEGYGTFEEDLKGKRLFLIRHGEIRQHREKIFLGQTDVPLSEKGREQAAAAAEELLRQGISARSIYTSDLSRAAETAEIIRDSLNRGRLRQAPGNPAQGKEGQWKEVSELAVIREPRLREMSLGEWDGRYISEIREKYPEEYRRRGENLLTWKCGNDSENFYDLQYRVMKGFRSILDRERAAADTDHAPGADDKLKDIVIVSHSGVINVIVSNLEQKELADQIRNHIPNGGIALIDYTEEEELTD